MGVAFSEGGPELPSSIFLFVDLLFHNFKLNVGKTPNLVWEILPINNGHVLTIFLALIIFKLCLVQTPNFGRRVLSSRQSIVQILDALAIVLPKISNHEVRLNLAFFLTLSVSIQFLVQEPGFGKALFRH